MMQGEIYYLLIKIRRRAMVKKTAKEMLEIAIEMRKKSYAPYSNFCVGACLECTDGKYITGCNIENSSYGATNCAKWSTSNMSTLWNLSAGHDGIL